MNSRTTLLLLAVLAIPWWGCKGNINKNHPLIAVTDLISQSTSGVQGDGFSDGPAITPDGRFVAFYSSSSALAGPSGGHNQVFVRDRVAGTTVMVSVNPVGLAGNADSILPSISDNGQWVAFQSVATDLLGVGGDTNAKSDIFVRDLVGGMTIRVSVKTGIAGGQSTAGGLSGSTGAYISGDGTMVTFTSDATDLTAGTYTAGAVNVFRHPNAATGTTDLVSVTSAGNPAVSATGYNISHDGTMITFTAFDTNIIMALTSGVQHVYVWTSGGKTEIVSVDSANVQANNNSDHPFLSSTGTFVAFESLATNLAPNPNSFINIFVRNRMPPTKTTTLVSHNDAGFVTNANSQWPSISPDGRFVVFTSGATNLVTGDTNGVFDVFWRDLVLGITRRASVATNGVQANDNSGLSSANGPDRPVLTSDGRFVAFDSAASNLVQNDVNGVDDVFIHGPIY